MVVEKLGSAARAAEISPKVSSVAGALPIRSATSRMTKAVVAILVVLSLSGGVGAVGTPPRAGLPASSPMTKAVVAIDVSLSCSGGVGAVGLPVRIGLLMG